MSVLERRLSTIEGRLFPRLSESEELLCGQPWFVELLKNEGINIDDLKQTGSVFAGMPFELKSRLHGVLGSEIQQRKDDELG